MQNLSIIESQETSAPVVLVIQHAEWEKPGRIADAIEEAGLGLVVMNVLDDKKPKFPAFSQLAGVVLMGGPMGALDDSHYPGLKAEAKLVKAAVAANKPVLGVCLGHQIIATALGGKLKKAKTPEIGFGSIKRENRHAYVPADLCSTPVLHWHSDVVSAPEGAIILASSEHAKNQAFACGSALGLQFHLEVSSTMFEEWLSNPVMTEGLKKNDIKKIREDFESYNARVREVADSVFSGFAARCASYARALQAQS